MTIANLTTMLPLVVALIGATWYLGRELRALATEIEAVRGELRALRSTVDAETRERTTAESETRSARARCADRFAALGERLSRIEARADRTMEARP